MKRLTLCGVSLVIAMLAVSCYDNFEEKHTGGQNPTIPFGFDWNTTRDVTLAVGFPVVGGEKPEFALINVYTSPVLSDGNLIAQGMVNSTFPEFRTAFTLPVNVADIYVQAIAPDGNRAAVMVPVTGSALNVQGIRVAPVNAAKSKKLFTAAIAASAGEMTFSSLLVPVSEPVPVSYDQIITETPSSRLYIGGDTKIASYLIPAGVSVDKNIDLVGWINTVPTLYVAGRLELTGMVTVEKTRLVVLSGGEVVFGEGLTVNNSFDNLASVYVMEDGKLTVKSLSFASGRKEIVVNKGVLNITHGHMTMSGGALYTTNGVNSGTENYDAIDLKASSGAEVHNDGLWKSRKIDIDSSSSFINYENGNVSAGDVTMDQATLDQKGVFAADHMKFSSRVTFNNVCHTTVGEFEAQAHSVINLAAGSLLKIRNGIFHSVSVNFARMSMLDVETLDKKSYVSHFTGPSGSMNSDGAQAVMRIAESEYKENRNPMVASGLVEVMSADADGISCQDGATLVEKQTLNIPATLCNGGAGEITPTPVEPSDDFDVKGALYTYCFEDGWPWCGDYDMNDLVVVAGVDRKMKNGLIEAIRINWEARAAGADNLIAFALQLDKVSTANVASVVSTHAVGDGVFKAENGLERDNDNAVIPFFNSVGEVLERNNVYVNTETGMPKVEVRKHTTTVAFSMPVAPENLIESAFNFFVVVTRSNASAPERWREIHLATYLPTRYAIISGFNTVIETMPYKYYAQGGDLSNNGLMWGLRIPGEFRYPSEQNDIRGTYTEFLPWAKSGGTQFPTWYKGETVSGKLYE